MQCSTTIRGDFVEVRMDSKMDWSVFRSCCDLSYGSSMHFGWRNPQYVMVSIMQPEIDPGTTLSEFIRITIASRLGFLNIGGLNCCRTIATSAVIFRWHLSKVDAIKAHKKQLRLTPQVIVRGWHPRTSFNSGVACREYVEGSHAMQGS